MKKYYEVVEPVFDFLNERGNPYKAVGSVKLHHVISKHVIPSDKSGCMLSFSENGSKNYLKFCEGRFLKKKKKKKKLADTIKGITVPQFLQKDRKSLTENNLDATKSSLKRLGKAAKKIDITRSGGSPLLFSRKYTDVSERVVLLSRHKIDVKEDNNVTCEQERRQTVTFGGSYKFN